jgi:hypothetical protein
VLERVHVYVPACGSPERFDECTAQRSGDIVLGHRRELAAAVQLIRACAVVVPPWFTGAGVDTVLVGSDAFGTTAGSDRAATH